MTLIEKIAALTPEQQEQAKAMGEAEQLIAFLTECGTALDDADRAEVKEYFDRGAVALSDEELENVAGGGCGPSDQEKRWAQQAAAEGRRVKYALGGQRDKCWQCGKVGSVYAVRYHNTGDYQPQHVWSDLKCYNCGLTSSQRRLNAGGGDIRI
jgi:hypothetical protein